MGQIARKSSEPPSADVRRVVDWILVGKTEEEVCALIADAWSGRDAKPLIVAALAKIEEHGEPNAILVRGFAVEATRIIYQRALADGNLSVALRALKQLDELAAR